MESSQGILCAPLQQLQDEHIFLRKEMSLFYEIIEDIEFETGSTVIQLFLTLHQKILAFADNLMAHSKREEEWLFPMIRHHLDDNDKIIETLEREHEKAEQHLQDFLTEASKIGSSIDEEAVQWITVFAFQAHATLTEHFAKEEKALFPLAEKILTNDGKKQLERLLHE